MVTCLFVRNMNRAGSLVKNGFKKVTHVIFDLDGLLLDSEPIYTQATRNVIERYEKEYTPEIICRILGLPGLELAEHIVKTLDLPITPEEFFNLKFVEQQKLKICDCKLMPVIYNIGKSYGKEYTTEMLNKVLGTPQTETCKIVVREMKLPITPDMFNNIFNKESKLRLSNVDFMPGAERFVRHLYKHKVPMAVATSSSKDSYDNKTQKHQEFFSLFTHKVTGGSDPEVKKGKPSPDIFLICASRFSDNPNPEKCLVLEDAPNGVTAAVDAGMQCVMIPDPQIVTPDFQKRATLVLKSLEEFKPELFGLPCY